MPSDGGATVARPRGCEGALARFPLPWPSSSLLIQAQPRLCCVGLASPSPRWARLAEELRFVPRCRKFLPGLFCGEGEYGVVEERKEEGGRRPYPQLPLMPN